MGTKLYVGNLPYTVDKNSLSDMFAEFGNVASAQVIMDRETGRSKGFGFVEMASDQEAQSAISGLNGRNVGGRNLTVNEARPQEPRTGGFGGPRRGPGVSNGSRRGPGGSGGPGRM